MLKLKSEADLGAKTPTATVSNAFCRRCGRSAPEDHDVVVFVECVLIGRVAL